MKTDQKDSSGSPTVACCASFEGDDTFVIHNHDMNQEWRSLGGEHLNHGNPMEKTLLWTDHKIWFQVRGKGLNRGDKVTVDSVDLYVCESGGMNVAEGREMHLRETLPLGAERMSEAQRNSPSAPGGIPLHNT